MSESAVSESAVSESAASRPSTAASVWSAVTGRPWVAALVAVLLLLFPEISGNQFWIREIALIALYAMVVSGTNLSFGYAGEVQFGQVFMFATGAYVGVVLAVRGPNEIVLSLVLGGAAAALVGAIVALPAVRVSGWALAMGSFFLVICLPDVISIMRDYTGGLEGLAAVPTPQLLGQELTTDGLYRVIVIVAVLWFVCYRNLVTSRFGVVFRILRESPVLCHSIGFSSSRLKLGAYCAGAVPAGFAGCLFGFFSEFVAPDSFNLEVAIGIVAASIIGGTESVYGAVVGAAILQLGPMSSLAFQHYAGIVYGAFLILAATLLRAGISDLAGRAIGRVGAALGAHDPRPQQDRLVPPVAVAPVEHDGLVVEGVSKSFGRVRALHEVSLTAPAGEVTALIGANGSGKTTLVNAICGFVPADSGRIEVAGQRVEHEPAFTVARSGVRRTFQTPLIPRGVSAVDVVSSGRYLADRTSAAGSITRSRRYRRSRAADRTTALQLLDLVGLRAVADQEAASFSLGTRRLIEVVRVMCGQPRVLLLDEPASGLSSAEIDRLAGVLTVAAQEGIAVVLIEHNFEFVASVASRVVVLNLGEVIAKGDAGAVRNDAAVIESYLGFSASPAPAASSKPAQQAVAER